jgi:deoxyribodipyrimidine photo-lyase
MTQVGEQVAAGAFDQAGPAIVWLRRDLRLADNPALAEAAQGDRPVIPLFILDETRGVRPLGGAQRWWLDKSLRALAADLEARGSRLILRRGVAAEVIDALLAETGAGAVFWNRLYDPDTLARDAALKAELKARGLLAHSFNAALLNEPHEVTTGAGEAFKVFTPYWRAARARLHHVEPVAAPSVLAAPAAWPGSDALDGWSLHPSAPDWSGGFHAWKPGEAGALRRLDAFLDSRLKGYSAGRDIPAREATSRLSPHLHFGEIGPRQVWTAVQAAAATGEAPEREADKFLAELGWREFNHHLLFHAPDMGRKAWRPVYDQVRWRKDHAGLAAWQAGLTGYPMVDAGMRELWATGFMENRVRMIAASFLIKDLLIDWREGEAWFWDTLVDADQASNAGNWQWVAGSGADASPWFRIFNPVGQGEKFDADGAYVRRWIPELARLPDEVIHRPWTARPEVLSHARVTLGLTYPHPIVDHGEARVRTLAAYAVVKSPSPPQEEDA